ncbi:hypothetical protein EX30DRAFT_341333 [Ascodesmis nigricans]|uniref:MICOS complex subunit MIC60 n=1 Tax=Ascodesmis nigricans TaxID=341454 RepID=A0A4S2MVR5_9PEZI|nr:hypothetical protein EX30DRAFT_341333 [Ascodesmis nigricans]
MLRLSLQTSSTASAFARTAIGSSSSRTVLRLPRQPLQRRLISVSKSIAAANDSSKPPVLPGSASQTQPLETPPGKTTESGLSPPKDDAPPSTDATQVPLQPPAPNGAGEDALPLKDPGLDAPGAKSPPPMPDAHKHSGLSHLGQTTAPPPPPPPHPKKTRRFRNLLLGLTFISAAAFGGGVFYSLKSDNVHDFFTEYIPFGEEAVLYFEEREFRRRFPNALAKIESKEPSTKVTIPKTAGATWRVKKDEPEPSDVSTTGPHISSKKAEKQFEERKAAIETVVVPAVEKKGLKATEVAREPAPPSKDLEKLDRAGVTGAPAAPAEPAVAVIEQPVPTAAPSTTTVSTLSLPEDTDPVVKDLVASINTLISSVNTSSSPEDYTSALESAKYELERLNREIVVLKGVTDDKLRERDLEFNKAAQGLVNDANTLVTQLELNYREEFEKERSRLAAAYREKLDTELTRTQELADQKLKNELLEQAIDLKRQWISQIQDQVEHERSGRLGKLAALEAAVRDLENITASASTIVTRNLKTQQLFTALEAVRVAAESPDQPKPFLREMAALKEIAKSIADEDVDDEDVIAAAINSINPAAYQAGIATHPQLVERFRNVAREVRKAALLPEDAGIAAHAGNWLLSKLMFRKAASVLAGGRKDEEGEEDVETILARTEAFLQEGDVDRAAREVNQLRGWARILAMDWLREARRVLEVQQAVEVIAAEARVQSLRVQQE